MRKSVLLLVALLLCTFPSDARDVDVRDVKGTPLSQLSDAFEVLRRFSTVAFINGDFHIAGRGVAAIFVDGRKISKHTDLSTIPASYVEKVEIVSEPNPEYGNNDGSILITLIDAEEDYFGLTDIAEMTASPFPGGSNNLEISGRKGKLYYEGGVVTSYLKTKDFENRISDSYADKPDKSGIWLDKRKVEDFNDVNKDFTVIAKAAAGWTFSPEHLLRLRYEYEYYKSDGDWENLKDVIYRRDGGTIDLEHPSDAYDATSTSRTRRNKHSISLGYEGKVENWKLTANVDVITGDKTERNIDNGYPGGRKECTLDQDSYYRTGETYSRFNASHPLWKGDIVFGLSFSNYFQTTRSDDYSAKNSLVHSEISNLVPGTFVSLKQDFGFLNVDLGLHYQYYYGKYTPCEDDQTRRRIIELIGTPYIKNTDWLLHPHLTLSSPVWEGKVSAGFQLTTEFPQLSSSKIKIDDLKKGDATEALTFPGRKDEMFLKGEWEWLQLKGQGIHHFRPIFKDIDSGEDFNGPEYWEMDWRLTLSPSVGIWESDLTATIHTQWLDMNVVDPADNLHTPLATINWINSFCLPWGMRVDLGTYLRTKGADKNIYYRNVFCSADLSVQQSFLKNRLVVSAEVDNLLRTKNNLACYTRMSEMEFDRNERLEHRTFRISVKFTL